MAYIIPSREISIENRQKFRTMCVEQLIGRALDLGIAHQRESLTIKGLRPEHLGLMWWEVPKYQRSVKFVDHQIDDNKVIGIYKVLQLAVKPTARTITFKVGPTGAKTQGKFDLDGIYAEVPILAHLDDLLETSDDLIEIAENATVLKNLLGNPMEGYITEMIRYDPKDHALIELNVSESSDNYLVLGGFVCGHKGNLV